MSIGIEVTDKLINDYLPLIKKIARFQYNKNRYWTEIDDLIQIGTIGFLEACKKYNPEKNCGLSTFVFFRIQGSILDAMRKSTKKKKKIK